MQIVRSGRSTRQMSDDTPPASAVQRTSSPARASPFAVTKSRSAGSGSPPFTSAPRRERGLAGERRAACLLDAHELVVFRETLRRAQRPDLDLSRSGAHGEIGDERVLRL